MIAFLKNIFESSSNFFHEQYNMIVEGKKNMDAMLQIWGYEDFQIEVYKKAYDYFCENPNQFDGATMTEDLCDIKGLEFAAMLHDYLYVVLNASASLHFIRLADELLFLEMSKMNKSTWNLGYRKFALGTVRRFWVWYCKKLKNRIMTINNQIEFLEIYKKLT